MEGAQRRYIIGGNWKCNGTIQSVKDLVNNILNRAQFDQDRLEVIVAPISIHIASVKALLNQNVLVASQNMGQNSIYTGEISGEQLKDFDVKWVILGHSERRNVFNETNQIINAKVLKAQQLKLNTIICVGENAEQKE